MAPVNTVKIIGVSFKSTNWNPKYCRNSVIIDSVSFV